MRFRTMNSTYEADQVEKRIRRIEGTASPTPRQGEDGTWRDYDELIPLPDGRFYIAWLKLPWGIMGTMTSPVTYVEIEGHDE